MDWNFVLWTTGWNQSDFQALIGAFFVPVQKPVNGFV